VRLRVDLELCVGHGRCYALAPDLFGEDERGHCVLLQATPPPELADQARLAEQNCPEGAIVVEPA
jgi:ferredoxin